VPGLVVEVALGGGERTEAYVVRDARGQASVVKVLRPDRIADAGARRRLIREARLLGRLEHAGITRVLRLEASAARPFLQIEHVPGPRLSTDVRHHGPLVARDVARLGRDLAGILAHVHERGVVHLDVKPANVVLGPVPHLIDFSVAHDLERAPSIDGFVGTDAWASPEQADPARWSSIGPAADVWGLGATLFFAVAGSRPFPEGDRHASGAARFPQLAHAAPALRDAPPALASLIGAMLTIEPSLRPSAVSAAEALASLAT
jgi:serine/threonine-protein kinase